MNNYKSEVEFLEDLYKKNIKQLRVLGREVGVYAPATLSKSELISQIKSIIYGTKMPVVTKSKKPIKDQIKLDYDAQQKKFIEETKSMFNTSQIQFSTTLAASPIVPFDGDTEKEIEGMDFTGISEDDVAICHITKKEQFIYDNKTGTKYPISDMLVENYQLSDGDFIYGICNGEKDGYYDFDIKWLNGYWLNKESLNHKIIEDKYFDLKDNFGYSRLVTLFAPIVRGKANLITTFDEDVEGEIINELADDIKTKYPNVVIRAMTVGLDIISQKNMDMVVGSTQYHLGTRLEKNLLTEIKQYCAKMVQYYKAGGEIVFILRGIQNLYELFYKSCRNRKNALKSMTDLISELYCTNGGNSLTLIATEVIDSKASCDLYANIESLFASNFEMAIEKDGTQDIQVLDFNKTRCDESVVDEVKKEFINKQKDLAKEQGNIKTFKNIVELINNTLSNDEIK